MKLKTQELFIILNKDHYRIEDYNEQNGKYVKATEINYIRVKLK
jgi:hypothetical protein